MPKFTNIAAYKFVHLTDLKAWRARLLSFCIKQNLKGSILLSAEGINLFVAGLLPDVESLLDELRRQPGLENFAVKISGSDHQPFNRMLVRIKKEIIAFGVPGINPAERTSRKIAPLLLKQWLDEGRPVTLLDTRNDYEVKLGTFKNALSIGVDHFREFPDAIRQLPADLKEQTIVMFCTGGIRCEKAGPFMEREGFKNIFQLDGGILKYFDECSSAHYEGECFVFDQRVGVDPHLQETESRQCFVCQTPLNLAEQKDERFVPNQSCSYCFKTAEEQMRENISRRHAAIRCAVTPLPGSQPYDRYRPINVPSDCDGKTLLDVLSRVVVHLPRHYWEAECERGLIVNQHEEAVSAAQIVRAGERYLHKFPQVTEPDVSGNIQILHEDEALIVLHKPAPLPMHAAGRFNRNTLQYILNQVYHPQRPHPAHRLDANTSGLVLVTRSRHFASRLQPQFERGEVEKIYLARVLGKPRQDTFNCDAPISERAGKEGSRTVDWKDGLAARTEFRVLQRDTDETTLLEARPITGRTNQIRVHLWQMNIPILGDTVYLPRQQTGDRQTLGVGDAPLCLHSWRIAFQHPLTKKTMQFCAPPPAWANQVSRS